MEYERAVEPRLLLSDFLRHELASTARTSVASTASAAPARCCSTAAGTFVPDARRAGRRPTIETVESLANGAELHPLQQAFHENFGLQCGFCTPGILMTATFFLEQNPDPTEEEIRAELAGNLCRCTGYAPIVDSILDAALRG